MNYSFLTTYYHLFITIFTASMVEPGLRTSCQNEMAPAPAPELSVFMNMAPAPAP